MCRWPPSHWPFLHAHTLLVSLLIKTPLLLDQGPALMTTFNFNSLLKGPASNIVTWRVRALAYKFWEDTTQYITLGNHKMCTKLNLHFEVMHSIATRSCRFLLLFSVLFCFHYLRCMFTITLQFNPRSLHSVASSSSQSISQFSLIISREQDTCHCRHCYTKAHLLFFPNLKKIEMQLTYNIILVSGVQHNDSIFVHMLK